MENRDVKIRLFGVANDSIVDGPGLRYAIYTQGCNHACKGCHNPESWAKDGGTVTTVGAIVDDILDNHLITGITLSGGDPFLQSGEVAALIKELKRYKYNIWTYTGYTYEDLLEMAKDNPDISTILKLSDVLVDGPFVESQKSLDLKWKGSSNQRVIDLNKTRQSGEVSLYKEFCENYEIPDNW